MKKHVWAFLAGALFAGGLSLSGMTRPEKVKGFLDFFGSWDPTLLIVLAVAVGLYIPAVVLARRSGWLPSGVTFVELEPEKLTPRFFVGSAMFGIGWGMVGLCPGPALVSLGGLGADAALFCAAMLASIYLTDTGLRRWG